LLHIFKQWNPAAPGADSPYWERDGKCEQDSQSGCAAGTGGTGGAAASGTDPAVEVVITAAYPVTPITSLCEQKPGARLFSRSR